jgi:DNA helicase-2/ATP-dependent DNA helicase PcrA
VFESRGARAAIETYVRLFADLHHAAAQDVALVFRVPGRGLPLGGEDAVAAGLRDGRRFVDSVTAVSAQARQPDRLLAGAAALDTLRTAADARQFISFVRSIGGVDEHFMAHERTFAAVEQIELEVLDQAGREARGRTLSEYRALLEERRERLRAIRDDVHGIELTTIHRAKGREWPDVHLFGADEGQLPHQHSLEADPAAQAAGEGLEAERRLAYVAFTRARHRLTVHAGSGTQSRFLSEAGLFAPPPSRRRDRA